MKNYKAFTLAEASIVMIVLGVIAVFTLQVLKPGEIKQKANLALAKEVYRNIDTALDNVKLNHSPKMSLEKIYSPDKSSVSEDITTENHLYYLSSAMQSYLKPARENKLCTTETDDFNFCYHQKNGIKDAFFLKNGAWIGLKYLTANVRVASPAIRGYKDMFGKNIYIFFDTNGQKEPNALGLDRYVIPILSEGIFPGLHYKSSHQCDPGWFYFEHMSYCLTCPNAFYCPDGKSMFECPDGYTTNLTWGGATSIDNCTVTTRCARGEKFNSSSRICEPCPKGYYCDGTSYSGVSWGGNNYTNTDAGGARSPMDLTIKVECSDGEEGVAKTGTCKTCEKGYYCVGGTKYKCGIGNYCLAGSSSPTPCPSGKTTTSETSGKALSNCI